MNTVLLPCDGSPNALRAVEHVLRLAREGAAPRVHLLNVQPLFSAHVARHIDRATREDFLRERAEAALAPARRLLDAAGLAYQAHIEVGDKARSIADAAGRLGCDRIVVGTARKSALLRAVEDSLSARLMEISPVPVEVIAGAPAGALERVGIPAGVGAGLALLWAGSA